METEFEAMFYGVAHDDVRARLERLGAELKQREYDASRTIFDYKDLRLDSKAAWIRLRRESDRISLTYKQRQSETIEGMKEIELTVDDYEKTKAFFIETGLTIKSEQQSKREVWLHEGVEIMLDTWPWIPPVTEIEGSSEADVKRVSDQLGFVWGEALFDSVDAIYVAHYEVTRTEICTVPWTFDSVPEWLQSRKR